MPHVTVAQLASLVRGTVHGDALLVVESARSLHEAGPADISFVENQRSLRAVAETKACALVVTASAVAALGEKGRRFTLLEVADSLLAFVRVVQHLQGEPTPPPAGVDARAAVDPTATIGPGCSVMPFAAVGKDVVLGARCRVHPGAVIGEGCKLGDDVTLHPGVVLYPNTVLGDRVTVHAHAVLGADGFGYRFQDGKHVKVPQLGHVVLGDDVEIGAGSTVDRGTFQATRIGDGTKIDNLVMVAHNCTLGRHNVICSQVGIAGSVVTGDYVVMAGQVGVADHVTIHDRAVLGAGSGVPNDIPAGERHLGYPCRPERDAKRIMACLSGLPEVVKDVRRIKKSLGLDGTGQKAG